MIELYMCDITGMRADTEQLLHGLSLYRHRRTASIRVAHDRLLSAVAGRLLSEALAVHGYHEAELNYQVTPEGKPYFTDCPLQFSLSHSGSMAICALSDEAVGADVQVMTYCRMRIAHRFFTAEQCAQLRICDDPDTLFTLFWAQTEARGKRSGIGIAGPCDTTGNMWSEMVSDHALAVCGPVFDGHPIKMEF